jgi:hypothetical protein
MKKTAYVVGGVLLGFVLATTTRAFADSVKSLIGKTVTGEYTVVVNGEKIADKGAVIDGRANVPVRGISEALGADIKVSDKTITITTEQTTDNATAVEDDQPAVEDDQPSEPVADPNKYNGRSKENLLETLSILKDRILAPNLAEREGIAAEIERLTKENADHAVIESRKGQLAGYDERIAQTQADIALAEAALSEVE